MTQKPEAGVVYSLLGSGGRTMVPINEGDPLPLGQVVSYGDMANPRSEKVVVEAEPGQYGQRCIDRERFSASDVSLTAIEGPGGWEMVGEIAPASEVLELKVKHIKMLDARAVERSNKAKANDETEERGRDLVEEKRPAWAQAVIVATLEVSDCDIMTDYWGQHTTKTLILAWSKHTRDLFPEMRKAALNADETKHLFNAPESGERREKWSMGKGYYLAKDDMSTYSGWQVRKWPLGGYMLSSLCAAAGVDGAWRIPEPKKA